MSNENILGQTDKISSWKLRIAGICGGLLFLAGNFYGPLATLQLFAFLPMMVILLKNNGKTTDATVAGLYMSLAYVLPQMAYLRMPVVVTIILLVYMTAMLTITCTFIGIVIHRPIIQAALLAGTIAYSIDYINCTILPIWGLAQSFARSWSSYPFIIGFISITGICGVMFILVSLQVLAAHFITQPSNRRKASCVAAITILACGITDYLTVPISSQTLKVATIGWVLDETNDNLNPGTEIGFEKLFIEPAQEAAKAGAKLISTGELGFYYNKFTASETIGKFTSFAKENNVWLSIGVYDISAKENKVLFVSPEGKVAEDYTKTHLTPLEPGNKGPGHLKSIEIEGFDIGTMICQDDNFPEQTTTYGRNGTGLLVCPTADWTTVRNAHLQAVRARCIESHYSIVRAAANGISAIIDPGGKIIAKMDHYTEGPGWLIADVPICPERTAFSRFGFALPFSILLLAVVIVTNAKRLS